MKKIKCFILLFALFLFFLSAKQSEAGTLQSISDRLDTPDPGKPSLHSITFTTQTDIPTGGKILIRFPDLKTGDSNEASSPSASTFQLNNIAEGDVEILDDNTNKTSGISVTTSNPTEGTSPVITITLDSISIADNSVVKLFLGCSSVSSGNCYTLSPKILNPTKTNAQGKADRWTITVVSQDSSSVELDIGRTKVGTIESVRTTAIIDPLLTMTISGIKNDANINTGNSSCKNTDKTNTGADSSATIVSLGNLSTTRLNSSAQLITITTNVASGYSLSAVSEETLRSATAEIHSSVTPTLIESGKSGFGIRPCGLEVSEETWGEASENKFAWPSKDNPLFLSSDSSGPVANSITPGNGLVSVEYGATISEDIPAGSYKTSVTYILTTTF